MTPSLNPGEREQWLVSRPIPSWLISVLLELFSHPPFLPRLSPLCQSGGSRRKRTSHSCLGSHPLSFLLPKSIFSVPIPLMAGRSSSSTLTSVIQLLKWGKRELLVLTHRWGNVIVVVLLNNVVKKTHAHKFKAGFYKWEQQQHHTSSHHLDVRWRLNLSRRFPLLAAFRGHTQHFHGLFSFLTTAGQVSLCLFVF